MIRSACLIVLHFAFVSIVSAAAPQVDRNPQSGQLSWTFEQDGLGFQLIQLHPDYVTAFYSGRGLPRHVVEHMRAQCIFGTIVRNISDTTLAYRVTDWRYITPDGEPHPVRSKSDWVAQWQGMGTAFKWSLLPDDQTFAVGDWNQGFTTIDLPHGARFDLKLVWQLDGQTHEMLIKEVTCAAES